MASFSEKENEIIQKDREENPGCFYSTAYTSSCRTINGESKCETIKKVFRQCPGKKKELIVNSKEVTEDEHGGELTTDFYNREHLDKHSFGDFFGSRNPFAQGDNQEYEAEMSPFDFLRREMLRPFEGLFGGSGGGLFGGDPFEGFDDVFQKQKPGPFQRNKQEASPPHYSYNPSIHSRGEARQGEKKKDAFEGYTGPVEEI